MPPKKLFLDISSPRRTSPVVALPDDSIQQDSHMVRNTLINDRFSLLGVGQRST